MTLYTLIKFVHILAAMAVVAGVIGRALLRARVIRIDEIAIMRELIGVEGQFDEWLVARGSIAALVTGVLLAWLGHWPLLNGGVPTWTLVGTALFLATIPLVIWVYVPRGKVFGKIFQEALAQNAVTVALRAALSDSVISACYLYDYIMFPVVIALMVIQPF